MVSDNQVHEEETVAFENLSDSNEVAEQALPILRRNRPGTTLEVLMIFNYLLTFFIFFF